MVIPQLWFLAKRIKQANLSKTKSWVRWVMLHVQSLIVHYLFLLLLWLYICSIYISQKRTTGLVSHHPVGLAVCPHLSSEHFLQPVHILRRTWRKNFGLGRFLPLKRQISWVYLTNPKAHNLIHIWLMIRVIYNISSLWWLYHLYTSYNDHRIIIMIVPHHIWIMGLSDQKAAHVIVDQHVPVQQHT